MNGPPANRPLRVVIADDEALARRHLVQSLEKMGNVEICAQCSNGHEALAAVESHDPDLLLLDIQMPGMTGFDLVKLLPPEFLPRVIFVTAFDQYAFRAFDINALDYLLKPVSQGRLAEALSRYRSGAFVQPEPNYRKNLLSSLESLPKKSDRSTITVHDGSQHLVLAMNLIDYVEAAGNYVCIHYEDEVHVIRQTLKGLAKQLDRSVFIRIHRSTIVNSRQIKAIRPHINGEYMLTLGDDKRVKVSRTYKDAISQLL
jgi:two-component system LytT family response regulator